MSGIPVVISENGFGLPVRQVDSGAPVMTVADNGFGMPIVLSDLGAPYVVQGGGVQPLPTFPLAMGEKLLAFGDSMAERSNISIANGGVYSYLREDVFWAWGKDPRFSFDTWYDAAAPNKASGGLFNGANQGLGGEQFVASSHPGFLARMSYAASRGAQVVYFKGGWNDIDQSRTYAAIVADLETMLTFFKDRGIHVIIRTQPPCNSWPALDPRYQVLTDYNAYIAGLTGREGITVIDTRTALGDGNSPVAGVLGTDNVHLSDKGAKLSADILLPVLQGMYGAGSVFEQDPLAAGNYLPNAAMTGTTGTKNNGITGSLATGWVANRGNSAETSTIVASKEAISGSADKQVFTVTPANDAQASPHSLIVSCPTLNLATAGLAVGDWVRLGWLVEFDDWAGWYQARVAWDMRNGGTAVRSGYALSMGNGSVPYLPGTNALWMVTGPVEIPATVTDFRLSSTSGSLTFLQVYWDKTAAGSGVAKVSRPFIRKVSDPRPTWNL
jgi:lysophospholipase L1-like esterase